MNNNYTYKENYIYEVARIRSKELALLSNNDINSLLSQPDYESCLNFLTDKGWGNGTENQSGTDLLKSETDKTWETIRELVKNDKTFDVFFIENDFQNLKASIKSVVRDIEPSSMLISKSKTDPMIIYNAIKNREHEKLPEYLQGPGKEAVKTLLQTSDGQLCDIIIDKACLGYVYKLGQEETEEIIKVYTELLVASSNIKMAVRSFNINKSLNFIKRSLVECESINTELLATAATKSLEEIYNYLEKTVYKNAIESLKISLPKFELWCDNFLINKIKEEKYNCFTAGPLVAYIIARENEIKAARIILSGKLNLLEEDIIKERLRDMYV